MHRREKDAMNLKHTCLGQDTEDSYALHEFSSTLAFSQLLDTHTLAQ